MLCVHFPRYTLVVSHRILMHCLNVYVLHKLQLIFSFCLCSNANARHNLILWFVSVCSLSVKDSLAQRVGQFESTSIHTCWYSGLVVRKV